MRFLFLKHALKWPPAAGHDLRCANMLAALRQLGHDTALATITPPAGPVVAMLGEASACVLAPTAAVPRPLVPMTTLQQRMCSYWGIETGTLAAVRERVHAYHPDVTVAVGLDSPPLLTQVPEGVRVWYAGDEWVRHHLSLVRIHHPATWANVRTAAIKGLYERAFMRAIDRVWVVTPAERRAMRWLAGASCVDVIPNGVDERMFRQVQDVETPHSAVFWGRLDFEPNIDALLWFCAKVWPPLRARVPDASFRIIGYALTDQVARLHSPDAGIVVQPDVPDVAVAVASSRVVVLPFQSGGGIKNKLLEAAAMGKPVVCTRRACGGLRAAAPVRVAESPAQWVAALADLWANDSLCQATSRAMRAWVREHHTWLAAARDAVASVSQRPAPPRRNAANSQMTAPDLPPLRRDA